MSCPICKTLFHGDSCPNGCIQTVYITERQQDLFDAKCPKCGSIHTHLIAEKRRYIRFGKIKIKTKVLHLCAECGYRYK